MTLRSLYGFDLPNDLQEVWSLVGDGKLLAPLGVALVGPFDVLRRRFPAKPSLSPLLHWRWSCDPPELLTVMAGDSDGLHWGYWLDEGPSDRLPIASYYARDAYEIRVRGSTLGQALRAELEGRWDSLHDELKHSPDEAERWQGLLDELAQLRAPLRELTGAAGRETGRAWLTKHGDTAHAKRFAGVIAPTSCGMGVIAPRATYEPMKLAPDKVVALLRKKKSPKPLLAEADAALRAGKPATALQIGRMLWSFVEHNDAAGEILKRAYAALDRPVLAQIVDAHMRARQLPSLNVLGYSAAELRRLRKAGIIR